MKRILPLLPIFGNFFKVLRNIDLTKKNKNLLIVCPSADISDKRAEAKLGLAIEHTRRTINASNAATCFVESFLKDGVDYTGSINRMRWEIEVKSFVNAHILLFSMKCSIINVDLLTILMMKLRCKIAGLETSLPKF